MSHYRSNLRDIEFNLFEVSRIQEYLGSGPFAEIDRDTAGDILREVERLAANEMAASFEVGDREEVRLEDGRVCLPAAYHRGLDAFYEAGWERMGLPEEVGGFPAPASLRWGALEMFMGANPALFLYIGAPMMVRALSKVGTAEQKQMWGRRMIERHWGGTMVLTEPDAGSDVGAGVTKARQVDGDVYHLEGVKRFITNADEDYHENIVHLVLARPEGAGPGTKGLSMFIVPKFLVNADGTLGERNGALVTKVEEKMGIRGSATCELTLGLDRPCIGYLVGGVHQGIKQMFNVIEDARMTVGTKSMATVSTGYLNALAYAQERIQSADMAQTRDPLAPRVPIIAHPDVRRLLMMGKAFAEGMRALVQYTAWAQDQVVLHPEEPYWDKLVDLLLPLVKGYNSEKAHEVLAQQLQVFGGSGFLADYPLEQYLRDVKIDTIYEGTTAIQALDLLTRKVAHDQGQTLMRLAQEIMETVKGGGPDDVFPTEREALGKAMEEMQGQLGVLVGYLMASAKEPGELYKAGLHATSFLESLAELVMGWLLLRHADIAQAAVAGASPRDQAFYRGKVAAARWFVANVVPRVTLRRALSAAESGELMTLPVEAF